MVQTGNKYDLPVQVRPSKTNFMHLGKFLTLAVALAAAASTHGAKPIAPKKALAMIRAGYATATSATVTALRNTVATTGGTMSLTINSGGVNKVVALTKLVLAPFSLPAQTPIQDLSRPWRVGLR